MDIAQYILTLLPFYLIGTFPTGYLLAKKHGVDITKTGSGNVGATNISRSLGKQAGALVLLIDALKGYFASWLAWYLSSSFTFATWAGCCAVLGHCFSIPGKLKGGKGVATALGVYLFIDPMAALLGVIVFAALVAKFKIVSLASISSAVVIPLFSLLRGVSITPIEPMLIISLVVVYRHKKNLTDLINGNERQINSSQEAR